MPSFMLILCIRTGICERRSEEQKYLLHAVDKRVLKLMSWQNYEFCLQKINISHQLMMLSIRFQAK